MARAQAQYLEISDGSVVRYRWQNYYVNSTVTYGGVQWDYEAFTADGLADGQQASITIAMEASPMALRVARDALKEGWLAELMVYEFDMLSGNAVPQSDQTLATSFLGEIAMASGTLFSIKFQLGSSLAPVGAQFPPRKFSAGLIGTPLRF
jgi:hypothetical protein